MTAELDSQHANSNAAAHVRPAAAPALNAPDAENAAAKLAAGAQQRGIADLLDRDLPEGYLRASTQLVAAAEAQTKTNTESSFVFRIGSEWMALPTQRVQKVVSGRPPHSIPQRRGVLLGLISVQGELVVCVSLSNLLGIEADEKKTVSTNSLCYLVAAGENGAVAFPVDGTHGVVRYSKDDLAPVPSTMSGATALYTASILSWDGRSVGCLDEEMLFFAINRNLS
jgi:chemotaxis-related protein WspD